MTPPEHPSRHGNHRVDALWGGVLLAGILFGFAGPGVGKKVYGQDGSASADARENGQVGGAAAGQSKQVAAWIDDLRSDSFAVRELASEKLFGLGHQVLGQLRQAKQVSHDAEQSERLDQIIATLAEDDLELRIEKFLRGGEAELENWEEVEKWFGDSPRVREMFVDLYREHPVLVKSLDGTPQELSLGLSLVHRRVVDRSSVQSGASRRTDLIAMLLAMTKPNLNADTQYDLVVVLLLQMHSAYEFRRDPVFGEPFGRLVSRWMSKSDQGVRSKVLRLALDWEMDVALPLALKTLDEKPDPELLCRCMQAIAKQGEKTDAARLGKYLDDDTTVFRPQYLGGNGGEVQVGDVAAAVIAHLFDMPVTELGFSKPAEHPVLGIFYEELAIPVDPESDDKQGDEASDRDDELLERLPPGGLDNLPPQQRRTWQRFQQLREANLRREATRREIREKAKALLSKLPAEVSEKS